MTTKLLLRVASILAVMTAPSALFAQVKVGSNPTTIETNSNLEVEASTTGRKVKVDKTTGQVTIADGTQGTNKVLISDATGGASWQNPSILGGYSLVVMAKNDNVIEPTGSFYTPPVPYLSGDASTWNATTGEFTAPTSGFYQFNYSLEVMGPGPIFTIEVAPLTIEDGTIRYNSTTWNYRTVNGTKYLEAGEKYTPRLYIGGGSTFNSSWKLRKISTIIFKVQ